jgi:hypothetical protein
MLNIHYNTVNLRRLIINTSNNLRIEQNTFRNKYKTPTCFSTGVPSTGRYSEQRSIAVGLTFLCSEYLPVDGTPVPKHVGVLYLFLNVFY